MTDLPVEVIRSPRRKRTTSATLSDGRILVRVPQGLAAPEEARLVEQATERVLRNIMSRDVDLAERARHLSRRYRLGQPASIEWSSRQTRRWGSCTPDEGRIRISDRLLDMPRWVLDSVIVHELAHLEVANHGPRFQELVNRYALTERARGYLMAKDHTLAQPNPPG